MIAKDLFRLLLLLVFLSPVLAPSSHAGQGLVYTVTQGGGPPSFLVGTMHSEDSRVVGQMGDLSALIDRVDTVAIEVVPDAVTLLAVGAATLLPTGQNLREVIGARRFAELEVAARRAGVPIDMLNRLRPWAVALTLGMPAAKTGRFLDMEIYLYALARQRKTVGLETAAEQLAVFDGLAPEVQLMLLDEVVKGLPELPLQFEALTAAYLEGDLPQLDRAARAHYADLPDALRHWYDETLLGQRNQRMLSRLSALIDGQSVLAAVGALHLGGETGLVEGLRRLGFVVERWPGSR